MKILCLDQATKVTGYSVWSNNKLKKYGTLTPEFSKNESYIERMTKMCHAIETLIKEHKPDMVCLEDVQYQSNQRVYKILSQLQGYIFAVLDRYNLPFVVVEPLCWKSHAGVKSKRRDEQKRETVELIQSKYNIDRLSEDEADAIAIGGWAVANIEIERMKG